MVDQPILIVDDNAVNLSLLEFMLSAQGYSVRTAANAQEALSSLAAQRPWLILMDLQMPGMDGFELTRRLKADPGTRDIFVVAVTAYAMNGDEQRARSAGCDDYLSKPIDKALLRLTVARYLARRNGEAD